jgi:uncharacterized membrane protein YedE/YeeE
MRRMSKTCSGPARTGTLDLTGAVLFGIGWGLAGICPGPALVNLAGLSFRIVVLSSR